MQVPEPLSLVDAPVDIDGSDEFTIFRHGLKSRRLVVLVVLTYFVVYLMFANFVLSEFRSLEVANEIFLINGDFGLTRWIYFLSYGSGWLLATAVFIYFLWSLIDIWGLQVCVNSREIRVVNTLTGNWFTGFMGTGMVLFTEIDTIRSGKTQTYLEVGAKRLRFSPVENVELLVQHILVHAVNARIESKD